MKTIKFFLCIAILILLESCVMKSLNPFYKRETITFNDVVLGEWTDSKKGKWNIGSFKEEFEKENSGQEYLNDEDKEILEKYKDGYVISYTKSDKEVIFIAVPFKVNDNLYIDFTPFYFEEKELNSLLSEHLLKAHSVAKLSMDNNEITFSFLSESTMRKIFEEGKIRLNHSKGRIDNNFLLTANSEELYDFLVKFDKSENEDKWKSSDTYSLKKVNVQP